MHALVAALTLCLSLLLSCRTDSRGDATLAEDLPRLSRELALPLPPETKVIWAQREEGMDDLTRAKLTMSTAQFAKLAPRLPVTLRELRNGPGPLGPNYEGWDPKSVPGLRSGETTLADGRAFQFGYVEHGGTVTLFVANFGT